MYKDFENWLLKQIRAGKINLNSWFTIFDIDGLVQCNRGDFIPASDWVLEEYLKSI